MHSLKHACGGYAHWPRWRCTNGVKCQSNITAACDYLLPGEYQQTLEWERHGRGSEAVRPEPLPVAGHSVALAQPPASTAAADREPAAPLVADIELPPHLAGCAASLNSLHRHDPVQHLQCMASLHATCSVPRTPGLRALALVVCQQAGAHERRCADGGGRGGR